MQEQRRAAIIAESHAAFRDGEAEELPMPGVGHASAEPLGLDAEAELGRLMAELDAEAMEVCPKHDVVGMKLCREARSGIMYMHGFRYQE